MCITHCREVHLKSLVYAYLSKHACLINPGFFFTVFFYFASKWISPILEFRKKILEFRGKFLEFREKILSLGRKNWEKMSVFTYFF